MTKTCKSCISGAARDLHTLFIENKVVAFAKSRGMVVCTALVNISRQCKVILVLNEAGREIHRFILSGTTLSSASSRNGWVEKLGRVTLLPASIEQKEDTALLKYKILEAVESFDNRG